MTPVDALMVAIAIPNVVPSAVNGTGTFFVTGGLHHRGNVNTAFPLANDVAAIFTFNEFRETLDGVCTVTLVPAHH